MPHLNILIRKPFTWSASEDFRITEEDWIVGLGYHGVLYKNI